MRRDFLMLADTWNPIKHAIGGWWMSHKLDGMRAFWDGGISRRLPATEVPYSNTAKDARYKVAPVATGLWTRYGKVIQAPDSFLDGLPRGVNLDMELWAGNNSFQFLMSTCKQLVPVEKDWGRVKGYAIDAPGWTQVLMDGELTGTNWKGKLNLEMLKWVETRTAWLADECYRQNVEYHGSMLPFKGFGLSDECFAKLMDKCYGMPNATWEPMDQVKLPLHPGDAKERVEQELQRVTSEGGEGLILRKPTGAWFPKRVNWLLKVKKLHDAEATVTGFVWGRETNLGSKLLGLVGALITDFNGKRLELSGFTNQEREVELVNPRRHDVQLEPQARAGMEALDEGWVSKHFPKGSKVTFTYRELSDDGVPKEARYLRRRND